MNLSTVLRIIVSCLLNAVVAWTVDYYATSLLSAEMFSKRDASRKFLRFNGLHSR